jgi:hypothetical protein
MWVEGLHKAGPWKNWIDHTNWIYLDQDELSYSIKCPEINEQLSDWQLLMDSASWSYIVSY